MESWVWVLIGFVGGLVVFAILNLIFAKDPSDELEKLADERAAELSKAEMKTAVLQDKLLDAETARDEQAAKSETDCRERLTAAESACDERLAAAATEYRGKLAYVQEQFTNLESAFSQQAAEVAAVIAAANVGGAVVASQEEEPEETESVILLEETAELDDSLFIESAAIAAIASADEEVMEPTAKPDEVEIIEEVPLLEDSFVEEIPEPEPFEFDEIDEVIEEDPSFSALDAALVAGGVVAADAIFDDEDALGEVIEEPEIIIEEEPVEIELVDAVPDEVLDEEPDEEPEEFHAGLAAAAGAAAVVTADDVEEEPESEGEEPLEEAESEQVEAMIVGLPKAAEEEPVEESSEEPEEEPVEEEPEEPEWPEDTSVWKGEYFNNMRLEGEPDLVREDAEINFDWGEGSPAPEIKDDRFSVRWTRAANLPPGLYRFIVTSDDGARLWVNERLVISAWYDHTKMTFRREIDLPGGFVDLKLEYYENDMDALVQVSWERIG